MKTKCCDNPGAVSSHVAPGRVPVIHPVSPRTDVLHVNSDAMAMTHCLRRHSREPAAVKKRFAALIKRYPLERLGMSRCPTFNTPHAKRGKRRAARAFSLSAS